MAGDKRYLSHHDMMRLWERSFVAGFRGLKKIGYQDYCSLECQVEGDPMVEIPKSFAFLKSEWKKATV